jgi:hypothetical protein
VGPSQWSEPFAILLHRMHAHPNSAKRVKPRYSPLMMKYPWASCSHRRHQWPWALRGPTHVQVVHQTYRVW